MKLKTRRLQKIEKKLLKNVEKQDPKAFNELCNLIIKEGIVNVLQSVKSNKLILNPPAELPLIRTSEQTTENSIISSKKPSSLPRLKTLNDISDPYKDSLPLSGTKSLASIMQSRASPVNVMHQQLSPITTVPNVVLKAGFKSRVGHIKGKPKIHNQDSVIIKPFFQNIRGQYLFAVSDGHGPEGHLISDFLKESLTTNIEMLLAASISKPERIEKAMALAYDNLAADLANTKIESLFSGSTLITVIISGNKLICANAGDCGAVLGVNAGGWEAVRLNLVHNLENANERERMIAKNARIEKEIEEKYYEKRNVLRAYMGNQSTPGLEITRSIGDKYGKFIGVISRPDTVTCVLTAAEKFLIIGSSGFWKVFNETEAVSIVAFSWQNGNVEESCEDLIKEANRRWKIISNDKEDISVIVAYLDASA